MGALYGNLAATDTYFCSYLDTEIQFPISFKTLKQKAVF